MPLYEYQCKKCRHVFEKIQLFSDPPLKKCPKCGGPVERLISAPAVQFKGSGWYVTDYARSASSAKEAGHDKSMPSDSAPASSSEKDAAKSSDKGNKSETAKKTSKTESK